MNGCVSFFLSGQCEGIIIVLQALSNKDNHVELTKEYVVEKLTELELTNYIEPIINEFYTN